MKVSRQEQRRVRDVKKPNSNAWRTGKDGSAVRANYGVIEVWFTGQYRVDGKVQTTSTPLRMESGIRSIGHIEGYLGNLDFASLYFDEARILKWRYHPNGQDCKGGFQTSRTELLSRVRPESCFVHDCRRAFRTNVRHHSSVREAYNTAKRLCEITEVPLMPFADFRAAFTPLHIRPKRKGFPGYSFSPHSQPLALQNNYLCNCEVIFEWINNHRRGNNRQPPLSEGRGL